MLVLLIVSDVSCWNAVWLPHSGGKAPFSLLTPGKLAPRYKVLNEGKEELPDQAAGSCPVRGMSTSARRARF